MQSLEHTMSKKLPTIWDITPHTKAKHLILKAYFQAWFSIVGQKFDKVIYVDGFCGPGIYSKGEPGSPILVIDEAAKALQSPNMKKYLNFEVHCFDSESDRIDNLNGILSSKSILDSRLKVLLPVHGEFEEKVIPVLEDRENAKRLHNMVIPSFFFIDPFGVKGFSMDLITRIFKVPSSEVFLLFDVDGVDRILSVWDDNSKKLLLSVYGVETARLQEIKKISSQTKRLEALRGLYFQSLRNKKAAARILPFGMYDNSDKVLYDLIFLTNNELGFLKMKEAMWKADESGEFRFSDADEQQAKFQFQSHEDNLWKRLMQEFAGKEVSGANVSKFVELETLYLNKHKTKALQKYESDSIDENRRIVVSGRKNKRKGVYPDSVLIKFPEA